MIQGLEYLCYEDRRREFFFHVIAALHYSPFCVLLLGFFPSRIFHAEQE